MEIFYKSRYCEDYSNRGPDNRGPPVEYEVNKSVSTYLYFSELYTLQSWQRKRAILAFNDYVCIDETFRVYAQYIFFTAKEPIVIMVTL